MKSSHFVTSILALLMLGGTSIAQEYPSAKPVKILVGATAGGGTDILARMLADKLGPSMKQSFVVENKPGAANTLAADAASKAPKGARPLLPRSLQIRRACAFNNPLGTAGSTRGLFNAPGGRPSGHPPIRPSGLRPPSFAKRTAGRHGLRPPRLGRRGAILAPTGGWKPPLLQNPKDWWINPIPSQGSLAGKLVAGKFPSTSPPTKTDPHAEPRRRGGSTQTRPHDVIYPPVAT